MKYILYIVVILIVLSAAIGYKLKLISSPVSEGKAALVINKRVITINEFNRLYTSQLLHRRKKTDFINSLITKELLIQESQKVGIDKEESFRKSIQNFYEQSLIKLLLDRKFASLEVTVSDDKLNRYFAFLNKRLHLTIFSFDDAEEAERGDYRDGESKTFHLEDLSKDIRNSIISLDEGKMTEPIKTGEKYVVVRLDKTEDSFFQRPSDIEKDRIKEMLIEEKKEEIINDWIADLRKKASIKILLNEKN